MIAFATLGCPGLDLDAVIDLAVTHGCAGVEFRYGEGEPVHPGLTDTDLAGVRRRLADAGIHPLALDSYIRVAGETDDEDVVVELRRTLTAARALGAGFVRVFPGGGAPSPAADDRAARRLAAVADLAADLGVGVLLETHDSHRRGVDAARVLTAAAEQAGVPHGAAGAPGGAEARPAPAGVSRGAGVPGGAGVPLGVVWDVLHTWLGGETPAASAAVLAPWLGYVQLKDVPGADDRTPVPPGDGALPLTEVLAELDARGYDGWLSLEYERAWHPEIPPLSAALPAFTRLVRRAQR